MLIFTGRGQDLTDLAHKENTHSEIFLLARPKILIAFCAPKALILDAISHGILDTMIWSKKPSHATVPLKCAKQIKRHFLRLE